MATLQYQAPQGASPKLPVVQAPSTSARGPSLAKRMAPVANLAADTLRVHEIYTSVQGEGTHVGLPCTFVRLTGCHLRCTYCDTPHAFAQGKVHALADVVAQTLAHRPRLVLLTGGEPLLQAAAWPLMQQLCDAGCEVLLETSGAVAIDAVDPRVRRIVDMKTPSSGEVAQNLYANLQNLRRHDEVKFVLGDRADYEWARALMQQYDLPAACTVLLGPVWNKLSPASIVDWMLADALVARLQVQVHKYIWHPDARGV